MPNYHIAQVNIGRIRAPLEDPVMAGFVNRLEEINALADSSPGFVWRLQTPAGNATYLRPYEEDDRILVNMSVWESIGALQSFVYRTTHKEMLRQREEWFERFAGAYVALWWVPAGHIPGLDEAKKRIAHLEQHGPTEFAFTFKSIFQPDEEFQKRLTGRRSGRARRCSSLVLAHVERLLLEGARDRDGIAPVVVRIIDAAHREGHVGSVTLHRHGP